jgi:prepilin-type N-terminal cleavage/methylation domain-containing protein
LSNRSGQKGFTLIEILVVIAIIAILAGMIVGVTGMARKRAMRAKASTNISTIKLALEAYNTNNGIYPDGGRTGKAKDDPWMLFLALYTGNMKIGGSRDSHLGDWPPESIGRWNGVFKTGEGSMYENPNEDELDFSTGIRGRAVFLDPWGHPYHYAEFDSRAPADKTLDGGQMRAKGGQRYAIWSDGPDGINDWGKNDDVNSWSEGGAAPSSSPGKSGS